MPLTTGSFYLHCWAHLIKTAIKHVSCAMGFHPLAATKREPASSRSRDRPSNDQQRFTMFLNPRTICLQSVWKMSRALKTQFTQHIRRKIMYMDSRHSGGGLLKMVIHVSKPAVKAHCMIWIQTVATTFQILSTHCEKKTLKQQLQVILLHLFTSFAPMLSRPRSRCMPSAISWWFQLWSISRVMLLRLALGKLFFCESNHLAANAHWFHVWEGWCGLSRAAPQSTTHKSRPIQCHITKHSKTKLHVNNSDLLDFATWPPLKKNITRNLA